MLHNAAGRGVCRHRSRGRTTSACTTPRAACRHRSVIASLRLATIRSGAFSQLPTLTVVPETTHVTPPAVLFVAGSMRSGTTLLAQMLAQHPQIFAAGELSNLWSGFETGVQCQCGRTIDKCPFWGPVTHAVLRAAGLRSPAEAERLRLASARTRYMPRAIRGPLSGDELNYRKILSILHRQILEQAGAATLVDTSKKAVDLLVTAQASSTAAVHLIRSPYGVAASESDATRHLNVRLAERPPSKGPVRSALGWVTVNHLASLAGRQIDGPMLRMQYEALVEYPACELNRILDLLHAEGFDWRVDGRRFDMPNGHLVNGNPSRNRTGWQELRPPDLGAGLRPHEICAIRSIVVFAGYGKYPPPRRPTEG